MQYSQICFLLCCCWCLSIEPTALNAPSGLSFFGNFQRTLLPYILGLGLMAGYMAYAAHMLRDARGSFVQSIRLVLNISAICTMGIIVTPSFSILPIRLLHFIFAAVLFAAQIRLGYQLAMSRWGIRFEHILLGLQIIAVLCIALSYRRIALLHVMIPAQVAAGLIFSALICRTLLRVGRIQKESVTSPTLIEEDLLVEEPSGSS